MQALASIEPPKYKNRTEEKYASNLHLRLTCGEIHSYSYESIRLRIGGTAKRGIYFTPDFLVILADGSIEFHEVKGFWREAAKVRINVAAEKFPYFKFRAVKLVKGSWEHEEF